jgi:hypothetical protein
MPLYTFKRTCHTLLPNRSYVALNPMAFYKETQTSDKTQVLI